MKMSYGIIFAFVKEFSVIANAFSHTFCVFLNISQVEKNIPDAYILACAPSNSAADQLCEKLIASRHVDARKIYRLYASSRNPNDIPQVLQVSACVS